MNPFTYIEKIDNETRSTLAESLEHNISDLEAAQRDFHEFQARYNFPYPAVQQNLRSVTNFVVAQRNALKKAIDAEAAESDLLSASQEVLRLIEEQKLVRNTADDGDKSAYVKQGMDVVSVLVKFIRAIQTVSKDRREG